MEETRICYTWLHREKSKEVICNRIDRNFIGNELTASKLQVSVWEKRELICFDGQLVSGGLDGIATVIYSFPLPRLHATLKDFYTPKEAIEPIPHYSIEGNGVYQNIRRIFLLASDGYFLIQIFDPKTLKPINIQVHVSKGRVSFLKTTYRPDPIV